MVILSGLLDLSFSLLYGNWIRRYRFDYKLVSLSVQGRHTFTFTHQITEPMNSEYAPAVLLLNRLAIASDPPLSSTSASVESGWD